MRGWTNQEIAESCNVSERTIRRDKEAWIKSTDFLDWIRSEWIRYHMLVGRMDPIEVYRQLTKLVGKQIAKRIAVETQRDVRYEITWKEE